MISKKDVSLVVKSENEKNLQKAREKIDAEIKKQYKGSSKTVSVDLDWMKSKLLVEQLKSEYEAPDAGWKAEINAGSGYDGSWCILILS